MPVHSQLLEEELWPLEVFVRPGQAIRIEATCRQYLWLTNSVLSQVVLVRSSHWPNLDLLVRLEIVPCLAAVHILHSPSRVVRLELGVVVLQGFDRAICRAASRAIGLFVVSSPSDHHGVLYRSILPEDMQCSNYCLLNKGMNRGSATSPSIAPHTQMVRCCGVRDWTLNLTCRSTLTLVQEHTRNVMFNNDWLNAKLDLEMVRNQSCSVQDICVRLSHNSTTSASSSCSF